MASKNIIFAAHECTVEAYTADEDGESVLSGPVWIGAQRESLTLSRSRNVVRTFPSGATHAKLRVVSDRHEIQIPKIWMLRRADRADYDPSLGQKYIFVLTWVDKKAKAWYRRTYYGVTPRELVEQSNGLIELIQNQVFDATRFEVASGAGIVPGASPDTGGLDDQLVSFFQEQTLEVGDYLLGYAEWSVNRTIKEVDVIGQRPTGDDTVITLEVASVLQASTITIPNGSGELLVSDSFDVAVPAGQGVRWKCTAGPAAVEDAAWQVALVMRVV